MLDVKLLSWLKNSQLWLVADGIMDICDCRVAFATEKKIYSQNILKKKFSQYVVLGVPLPLQKKNFVRFGWIRTKQNCENEKKNRNKKKIVKMKNELETKTILWKWKKGFNPPLVVKFHIFLIYPSLREAFNKKKTEKSTIVHKGTVGWTPKPYFRKEWNSDTIVG